jgi:hypothetical protein
VVQISGRNSGGDSDGGTPPMTPVQSGAVRVVRLRARAVAATQERLGLVER